MSKPQSKQTKKRPRKSKGLEQVAAAHELPLHIYAYRGDSENENGENIDAAEFAHTLHMDFQIHREKIVGVYRLERVSEIGTSELRVLAAARPTSPKSLPQPSRRKAKR